METTLRTWNYLESRGASCFLELSPDIKGQLITLFHCTDELGTMITYWLASPRNLIQMITSLIT